MILVTLIRFPSLLQTDRQRKNKVLRYYVEALTKETRFLPYIGSLPRREKIVIHLPLEKVFVPLHALSEATATTHVILEEILQLLSPAQPGAVLVGEPGSGKSVALRWLTYRMAQAYDLSMKNPLQALFCSSENKEGFPVQIPMLIDLKEYARLLAQADNSQLSFQDFLQKYYTDFYPTIPDLAHHLLLALQQGHCLFLLDGLDEIVPEDLRCQVSQNIVLFLSSLSSHQAQTDHTNHVILTSRQKEPLSEIFATYTYYILQEFSPEQIEQFFTRWYLAQEQHQNPTERRDRKEELSRIQQEKLQTIQDYLAKQHIPVYPFYLTLLALLTQNDEPLPDQIFDLYQDSVDTILISWSNSQGEPLLSREQLPILRRLLGAIAFSMRDTLFIDYAEITTVLLASSREKEFLSEHATLAQRLTGRQSENPFVTLLPSGWLVFSQRTFQEYFLSIHLLQLPFSELLQFTEQHCSDPLWHHPLLLVIAHQSHDQDVNSQNQMNALLTLLLECGEREQRKYSQGLLLAGHSMSVANLASVLPDHQQRIAKALFELYGTPFSRLQQNYIEQYVFNWLKRQPANEEQSPLLIVWRNILCDEQESGLQTSCIHLVSALAPVLTACPAVILHTLLPSVAALAQLPEYASPPLEYSRCRSSSLQVQDYALVTLHLLASAGPAGWLHTHWLEAAQKQPELLQRLSEHSLALDILLSPAALVARPDDPRIALHHALYEQWQTCAKSNPLQLQMKLLAQSETTRFPHAALFWHLLQQELQSPQEDWQLQWKETLAHEMQQANLATYPTCLYLRCLLSRNDAHQQRQLAEELSTAFSSDHPQQRVVMIALSVLCLRYLRDQLDYQNPSYFRYLRDLRLQRYLYDTLEVLDVRDAHDLRYYIDHQFLTHTLYQMLEAREPSLSVTALLHLCRAIPTQRPLSALQYWRIRNNFLEFERLAQQLGPFTVEQHLLIRSIHQRLRFLQR